MRQIDLAGVDLNLLVVLDVLLGERSVTVAAKRLHRTQSAVSHSLAKLRDELGDPLLVRHGNEMRPTPRAEAIQGDLARLLRGIARLFDEESEFDPTRTTRSFTIVAPDFVGGALPLILKAMAVSAPRARVELRHVHRDMFRDLVDGQADLVIAPQPGKVLDGTASDKLPSLDWAVFARRGHPATKHKWSRASWLRYPHIQVRTSSSSEGPIDRATKALRVKRILGPVVPHFFTAASLVEQSDFLLTVPRAVLGNEVERFALVTLRCPVRLPAIELRLHWNRLLERDPALLWFRAQVAESLEEYFS